MIFNDATTKSLQIKLGGVVTTNQLPWASSYVDTTISTMTVGAEGSSDGATNGATPVTIMSSPGSGVTRKLKSFFIQNADTAAATLTFIYNDNSTARNILVITLAVGDQMVYESGNGISVFDSTGAQKKVENLTKVGGSAVALGSTTSANSLPVVIASDQGSIPTKPGNASADAISLANTLPVQPEIYNGTTNDLARGAKGLSGTTLNGTLDNLTNSGTGIPVNLMLGFDNTASANAYRVPRLDSNSLLKVLISSGAGGTAATQANGDGTSGTVGGLNVISYTALFNGSTSDRMRGINSATVRASSATAATFTSADLVNYNWRGCIVTFNVSAIGAGTTWTLTVNGKDPVSGNYYQIFSSAAVGATGQNAYVIYPGTTVSANLDVSAVLPRTFQIVVTIGGTALSSTFSVGIDYIL